MKKNVLRFLLSTTLAFSSVTTFSFANGGTSDLVNNQEQRIININSTEVTTNITPDGKISIIKPKNPKEFAKKLGIPEVTTEGEVVDFIIKKPIQSEQNQSINKIQTRWGSHYIKITGTTEMCGQEIIAQTSATARKGGKLKLEVSESVKAKYDKNVNISASIISAGVGWGVEREYKVTQSYEQTVSSDGFYTIRAFPEFDGVNFDIWYDGMLENKKVGKGTAFRPVGACFVVRKTK